MSKFVILNKKNFMRLHSSGNFFFPIWYACGVRSKSRKADFSCFSPVPFICSCVCQFVCLCGASSDTGCRIFCTRIKMKNILQSRRKIRKELIQVTWSKFLNKSVQESRREVFTTLDKMIFSVSTSTSIQHKLHIKLNSSLVIAFPIASTSGLSRLIQA